MTPFPTFVVLHAYTITSDYFLLSNGNEPILLPENIKTSVMAVAASWDVFEFRMNVFMCLREDRCDLDLARCARVHRTWTSLALDALWLGYPRKFCRDNQMRTQAIALLPAGRRQDYASRIGVLDFTNFGGSFVHAMFEGLAFPS